jgi:hypothetical protein
MKISPLALLFSVFLVAGASAQAEPHFYCKTFWGGTKISFESTGENQGIVRFQSRSAEFTAPYTMWRANTGGGAYETEDAHQFRLSWGYFHDMYLPNGKEKNGYYVTEKRPYDIEYINDRGEKVVAEVPCWTQTRIQR